MHDSNSPPRRWGVAITSARIRTCALVSNPTCSLFLDLHVSWTQVVGLVKCAESHPSEVLEAAMCATNY